MHMTLSTLGVLPLSVGQCKSLGLGRLESWQLTIATRLVQGVMGGLTGSPSFNDTFGNPRGQDLSTIVAIYEVGASLIKWPGSPADDSPPDRMFLWRCSSFLLRRKTRPQTLNRRWRGSYDGRRCPPSFRFHPRSSHRRSYCVWSWHGSHQLNCTCPPV